MPVDKALELIKDRDNKFTGDSKKDIHESDRNHLIDAHNAACSVSKKYNWYEIKCVNEKQEVRTIEDIHEQIYNEIIKQISNALYEYLNRHLEDSKYKVFKPMPCPIDKIQNRYRWRIIIKGNMDEKTNKILNTCLKQIYNKNLKHTKVNIDVNPNNMM